jgi:hypothetical protein
VSHDHCDCVEGLEEHIAWQRDRLAEQDARGLRLAGENERLREDNENLSTANDTYRYEVEKLRELNDRAAKRSADYRAENERLREGLEAVLAYVPQGFISPMDDEDTLNIRAIARTALKRIEEVVAEDISP